MNSAHQKKEPSNDSSLGQLKIIWLRLNEFSQQHQLARMVDVVFDDAVEHYL